MHQGRSINNLMDALGHTGLCFFLLQEMCAEKLEKKGDQLLTDADCLFDFHLRFVRQTLRISPANLRRLLDVCAANGLLSFEFSGNSLRIKMPILLNLLDRDTKKARQRRASDAQKCRLDKEEERDKEREEEIEKSILSKAPKNANKELNRKIWDAYFNAYQQRYKVEPTRNASVNAQVSQLAKRLGDDAIEIVKFFLGHNDSFYLSKTHSIGLCLRDAESLRTQWLRNKPITKTAVRQFEHVQIFEENLKHIQENGI